MNASRLWGKGGCGCQAKSALGASFCCCFFYSFLTHLCVCGVSVKGRLCDMNKCVSVGDNTYNGKYKVW